MGEVHDGRCRVQRRITWRHAHSPRLGSLNRPFPSCQAQSCSQAQARRPASSLAACEGRRTYTGAKAGTQRYERTSLWAFLCVPPAWALPPHMRDDPHTPEQLCKQTGRVQALSQGEAPAPRQDREEEIMCLLHPDLSAFGSSQVLVGWENACSPRRHAHGLRDHRLQAHTQQQRRTLIFSSLDRLRVRLWSSCCERKFLPRVDDSVWLAATTTYRPTLFCRLATPSTLPPTR